MAGKHFLQPTVPEKAVLAVRLGANTDEAARYKDSEVGKIVKLIGDSNYGLAAAGDPIEGFIRSVEVAPADGYSIGGVQEDGRERVELAGSQAAGTGAIAVGDYVVTGAVTAKNTALPSGFAKVAKATDQAAAAAAPFKWRVVSLGPVGTGAVGTFGVIARV